MNKSLKIAGIVALAVVVVGLIAWAYMSQSGSNIMDPDGNKITKVGDVPDAMLADQTAEAAQATQGLINDLVIDAGQEVQTIQIAADPGAEGVVGEDGEPMLDENGEPMLDENGEPMLDENGEIMTPPTKEIKMVVVSPGTSGINIETGKVINETGEVLVNDVSAGSQTAPQSSFPVDATELPKSTIKLDATSNSFTPNEFTVNRGQAVSLAVTNANTNTFSEVFRFDDSSLSGVVLGLAKGETRSITFNAPDEAGEYTFYSDMFNHRDQGAVGVMIVK